MLEALEPVLSAIVVTQNNSPRAMPAEELGELADEIFGRDRVEVRRRLDDAIESAITIAEDETEYGGAGVLVFGSLVTVGEARTLLQAAVSRAAARTSARVCADCAASAPAVLDPRGARRGARHPGAARQRPRRHTPAPHRRRQQRLSSRCCSSSPAPSSGDRGGRGLPRGCRCWRCS